MSETSYGVIADIINGLRHRWKTSDNGIKYLNVDLLRYEMYDVCYYVVIMIGKIII